MKFKAALAVAAMLAVPLAAHAQVLDFEGSGLDPNTIYPNNVTFLNGFYNGGTDALGFSGTNYGVTFSSNAQILCYNTLTSVCSNTSRGGLAPSSATGGLNWLSGPSAYITMASGFNTGFSLVYAAPYYGSTIDVYSGIDGTGTLLAHLDLGTTASTCDAGYNAGYCPFVPIGVAFAGTAKSIVFGGTADYVEFDDITFGSVNPGNPVPEPATMSLMAMGLVGMAGAARRRRRK